MIVGLLRDFRELQESILDVLTSLNTSLNKRTTQVLFVLQDQYFFDENFKTILVLGFKQTEDQ